MSELLKIVILYFSSFLFLSDGIAQDSKAYETCIEEVSQYAEYIDYKDVCKNMESDNTWVSNENYKSIRCSEIENKISCIGTGTGTGTSLTIISLKNTGIISSNSNTGTIIINKE